MTKQEALQLFASHVDVQGLKSDFPDIDWSVMELEDGQQEIVIRLQGEPDAYHPAADLAAIEAMTVDEVSLFPVKNAITLLKEKRIRKQQRIKQIEKEYIKRIKQFTLDMGIPLIRGAKVLKEAIAQKVDEVI